jgi:hypothetical protein
VPEVAVGVRVWVTVGVGPSTCVEVTVRVLVSDATRVRVGVFVFPAVTEVNVGVGLELPPPHPVFPHPPGALVSVGEDVSVRLPPVTLVLVGESVGVSVAVCAATAVCVTVCVAVRVGAVPEVAVGELSQLCFALAQEPTVAVGDPGVAVPVGDPGVTVGMPAAAITAVPQLIRPHPNDVSLPASPRSTAVWRRMFSTPAGSSAGFTESSAAAQAATWGVAMEVPLCAPHV